MITDQNEIAFLKFLCRSYDGVNRTIVATKNRLQAMAPDMTEEQVKRYWMVAGMIENKAGTSIRYQGLQNIKDEISRRIKKELVLWPIWTQWMSKIPGIGANIGGNLILLYYYRFQPCCKDCQTILEKVDGTFYCPTCDKSVKGEGSLVFNIEFRDFPRISSWWHFMGRHNLAHCPACRKRLGDDDACPNKDCQNFRKIIADPIYLIPKHQAGMVSDWSPVGRQIGYQIADQFNRKRAEDHPYKRYLLERKARHEKKNETREKPWSKGYIHNAGKNETIKLFLSHFWQVARTLDGKPLTEPYIVAKNPVHNIIPPFYWDEDDVRTAAQG